MMIHVRPYISVDHDFVITLAARLAIGRAPWRDAERVIATAEGWVQSSVERHGPEGVVFIAERRPSERLGFAAVSWRTHSTGEREAYIGELATQESSEGKGVGTALVQACEAWARNEGSRLLALHTGSGNHRALAFYHQLGFRQEDVSLVKVL